MSDDFPEMGVELKNGTVMIKFYDFDLIVCSFKQLRVHNIDYHGYLRVRRYGGDFQLEHNEHGLVSQHCAYLTRNDAPLEEATSKAKAWVKMSLWTEVEDWIRSHGMRPNFQHHLLAATVKARYKEVGNASADLREAERKAAEAQDNLERAQAAWAEANRQLDLHLTPTL